jgi:hypothetical protein
MEDLTFLFEEEGWLDVFPQDLIDLISTPDGIWSVPVNIHRSNIMWYVPPTSRRGASRSRRRGTRSSRSARRSRPRA